MAIPVNLSINELDSLSKELGLSIVASGKNGKFKKEDYIVPIREHYLVKRYGDLNRVPDFMKLILNIKSPMLSFRVDNLSSDKQDEVFNGSGWVFEEKVNGLRCLLIFDGNTVQVFSRDNSDNDLLPVNLTSKILSVITCDLSRLSNRFIIDCELVSDSSFLYDKLQLMGLSISSMSNAMDSIFGLDNNSSLSLQRSGVSLLFKVFDCIFYNDNWILDNKLSERVSYLDSIINELNLSGIKSERVVSCSSDRLKFFESVVSLGGEGCIAKRVDGKYIADTTRNFNGWIKVKKGYNRDSSKISATDKYDLGGLVFGDSLDVFVSDFIVGDKESSFDGMIDSLIFSVYERVGDDLVEKKIAKSSNFNLSLRKSLTSVVDGVVTLNPDYYGRVCEVSDIDRMSLLFGDGSLETVDFYGFRFDKSKKDCIL